MGESLLDQKIVNVSPNSPPVGCEYSLISAVAGSDVAVDAIVGKIINPLLFLLTGVSVTFEADARVVTFATLYDGYATIDSQ